MGQHTGGADGHAGHRAGDGRLSGLSSAQSQRVRGLARTALAERGIETVVYADHLQAADGREFGLANLASACHNCPGDERAWPTLVSGHLDSLLARCPDVPPDLTVEQMRAGAYLRLARMDAMPGGPTAFSYARELGAGLAEIVVHREGDFVRWLNDEDVARADVAELRSIGRANLAEIRPDECALVRNWGGYFNAVRGGSGFMASKLLLLPDVVRVVAGSAVSVPDGVLVAVPSRHELVFAVVDQAVVTNLSAMIPYAASEYIHGLAPLSPYVYWWQDGRLSALTTTNSTGGLTLAHVEPFLAVMNRLDPDTDAA